MKTFRTMSLLVCAAAALAGCEKNAVQDITGPLPSARIRFFNMGINAPGVNFYANDAKVTAILSATGAESTTGVAYGGVGSAGFYSALAPGQYTFTGKIAAATDKDLAIVSVPGTLADGKSYSFYVSGFYNTATKSAEGFLVEDNFSPTIDFEKAEVRFVNASSNSSPMTLYAKETTTGVETPVGGPVAYKGAGAYTKLANGVYDLSLRTAGSATNLVTRTAVSFSAGRVYTISLRGDMTVTSTTATNRPFLDNTLNR